MRISRLIIALIVLAEMLFPKSMIAAAAGEKVTYDTKTKTEFWMLKENKNDNFNIFDSLDEGFFPEKEEELSVEELERSATLDKWRGRQSHLWDALPKGKFVINASAYTAAADECGKSDGITASGVKVKEQRTLACPPNMPFGAKLNIEGLGLFVCEDRGGAIKGNKIDIYVETKKEAFQFGRQNLIAEVIM